MKCDQTECEYYDEDMTDFCDLGDPPDVEGCRFRVPQPPTDVELFICYMIDNCEQETISEEYLQRVYADFLKTTKQAVFHGP